MRRPDSSFSLHSSSFILPVAVFATSQSGNIVRLGDAHPATMAAWRLAIASLLLAPMAGRGLFRLASLSARDRGLLLLAGVALSAHLCTWIAAVQITSVANAALFFAVNPVMTALGARWFYGERAGPGLVASIVLGLAGVAVAGWGDLHLGTERAAGDALALLCSLLFTVYFLAGKRVRQAVATPEYVAATYAVAAAASFAVSGWLGKPAFAHTPRTWLCFVLLALVPTMIGHTGLNHALRYVDAGRIAAATLAEPLLAGVVAFFAWGEPPGAAGLAGYALVAASVVVLVLTKGMEGDG